MDNPRADKVAVVEEVRERLGGVSASVVTEYRGLSVSDLAELRQSLTAAGGEYKVFKNTLVRLAVADTEYQPLEGLLTGPTAIAFVHGEVSAVAKALRDFSRANAHLVVKGGLLEGRLLSSADLATLADLPSREVLLASLAGGIAAPLRQLASLMQALPRNLAYGISALIDQRGGAPIAESTDVDTGSTDADSTDADSTDADSTDADSTYEAGANAGSDSAADAIEEDGVAGPAEAAADVTDDQASGAAAEAGDDAADEAGDGAAVDGAASAGE
jgi:large subunit ribosomal protein L10